MATEGRAVLRVKMMGCIHGARAFAPVVGMTVGVQHSLRVTPLVDNWS